MHGSTIEILELVSLLLLCAGVASPPAGKACAVLAGVIVLVTFFMVVAPAVFR
jgi:hypothetical protein